LAAFTRGSDRGYIYIEGDITNDLRDILRRIPGLVRTEGNPIFKFIPPSNRIRTLHLPKDRELRFTVGQWVQVLKGKYKGDLGYVNELLSWGGVRLLMVPRLPLLPPSYRPSKQERKRPRSTPPPLNLFNPLAIAKTFNIVPKKRGNTYLFNGDKFEDGLLVKDFGASAVSSASVLISTEIHSLFLKSQHPTILSSNRLDEFPNPAEWCFFTGEQVKVFCDSESSKGRPGYIRNVESVSVEVELESGELVILKDWYNIQKCVRVGDFVKVVGGVQSGRMGFVDHVSGPDISIIEKLGEEVLYFYIEKLLIDLLCS
jgi:transcription elongation factor